MGNEYIYRNSYLYTVKPVLVCRCEYQLSAFPRSGNFGKHRAKFNLILTAGKKLQILQHSGKIRVKSGNFTILTIILS